MNKLAMMTLCLVLLPYRGAHGQGQDSSRASRNAAGSTQAVDSQAVRFMPMMWLHLDSMGGWSPAHMQQMMATHQQMAGQMLQMMGPGSPWTALRDSIQGDLSIMPGLSGKALAERSRAHIDRMRRMMVLGMGMMGGGGWATMPGGCGMLNSIGGMPANQAQRMWAMHSQMSGQMISAMMANMRGRGVRPSPQWLALRDSVQADMAELPKLKGDPSVTDAGPRRPDAPADGHAGAGHGDANGTDGDGLFLVVGMGAGIDPPLTPRRDGDAVRLALA